MRTSFRNILIITAIPLAGLAVFLFWQWLNDGITPPEVAREVPRALREAVPGTAPAQTVSEAPAPLPARPRRGRRRSVAESVTGSGGNVVLIIDDLGFEGQPLDRVMGLDPNVSCSILPNGPRATEFATRLSERGFEILCHLPMQPRGSERPGKGAILVSMSEEEIARLTREGLEAVPNARGVNNHMGSLATEDRRVMTSVLGALPSGMYFIDSRTSGRSVAEDVAREMRVPTAARHVFLDDLATEAFVRRQLSELVDTARKRGVAVGIGHPYPATLRVLEAELPRLRESGLKIVRASEAVQ